MISVLDQKAEVRKLTRKRQQLREKLKKHFLYPVNERNYEEFEAIVDDLDDVRRRIQELA